VSIGKMGRKMLGPLEPLAVDIYRKPFIDLESVARTLASVCTPSRIAEIGCGEGVLATELNRAWPDAEILGIDITPQPGRLYRGDPAAATFRSCSADDLAATDAAGFDLVLMCDVLHHVPPPMRAGIVAAARALVADNGVLAIKDWEHRRDLATAAAYASDRFITGDRIKYFAREELVGLVAPDASDHAELILDAHIPPRRNNLLFIWRITRPDRLTEPVA
jgi:2-polyprenyl-6-hydroxyphenyl methylase/3-demethylubiquinone-9 3-methyltransferase